MLSYVHYWSWCHYRLEENNITVARMHHEVEEVEKFLEQLQLPKSVCHYDFHMGNCLYNQQTSKSMRGSVQRLILRQV